MAHSLELRVPFLDRELLEFASGIPGRQHLTGKETKSLLRAAVRELLPPEILRRPKRGFGTPIDIWLRMHLRPMMLDLLSERALKARGWFNPAYVAAMIRSHQEGASDYSQHLWALLIFEIWQRQFVDGEEVVDETYRLSRPLPLATPVKHRPLSILIPTDVDPDEIASGAERVLAEETKELLRRGHQVTIISRCMDPSKAGTSDRDGLRIVRFCVPTSKGIRGLLTTLAAARNVATAVIAQAHPDVIYIQQPLTGAGVLQSELAASIPVVYCFHSPWSEEFRIRALELRAPLANPNTTRPTPSEALQIWLRRQISRSVARRSSQVRVLSDFMAEQCRTRLNVPLAKLSLIPGAVDTSRFAPTQDRAAARARLGIGPDVPLLFTLRGLEARMGLGNLLDAMSLIVEHEPRAICIIGGTGPLAQALADRAQKLKLRDHVRFAGFIPDTDLPAYYSAADLFVLPTAALEGFGLVTVEAMACGTPVVGTPVGATPEILIAFDPSLIMPDASAQGIASGVLAALHRVHGDDRLRERCRRYVEANYTWPSVVDRLEHLLAALAEHVTV